MNIIIKTKNLELTESLEAFTIKKLGGLKKFLAGFQNHHLPLEVGRELFDLFVDLGRESNHHHKGDVYKVELKLYLPGKNLFVKSHGEDLMKTIIDAREGIESEIRRYKSKVVESPRRRAKWEKEGI